MLEMNLEALPGYSPEFIPVEHLWQGLYEDVIPQQVY